MLHQSSSTNEYGYNSSDDQVMAPGSEKIKKKEAILRKIYKKNELKSSLTARQRNFSDYLKNLMQTPDDKEEETLKW